MQVLRLPRCNKHDGIFGPMDFDKMAGGIYIPDTEHHQMDVVDLAMLQQTSNHDGAISIASTFHPQQRSQQALLDDLVHYGSVVVLILVIIILVWRER